MIQFDEQLEVIDQLYDVEVREKGIIAICFFFIMRKKKKKKVLKFHGQELVMTRFPIRRLL